MDTVYCTRCTEEDLPTGMLCRRDAFVDNGASTDLARYEGHCLKCCDHNHG